MKIMQEIFLEKYSDNNSHEFPAALYNDYEFQRSYSEYLMGGIKDQLSFYYREKDYDMFKVFFQYLEGKTSFTYDEYQGYYDMFFNYFLENHDDVPAFFEDEMKFLQFLYDTNIVCYIEEAEADTFFHWCYRERSMSNINPRIIPHARYSIHYGLYKALNLGSDRKKTS